MVPWRLAPVCLFHLVWFSNLLEAQRYCESINDRGGLTELNISISNRGYYTLYVVYLNWKTLKTFLIKSFCEFLLRCWWCVALRLPFSRHLGAVDSRENAQPKGVFDVSVSWPAVGLLGLPFYTHLCQWWQSTPSTVSCFLLAILKKCCVFSSLLLFLIC